MDARGLPRPVCASWARAPAWPKCCSPEVCPGNPYCRCILSRDWKSLRLLARTCSVFGTVCRHGTELRCLSAQCSWGEAAPSAAKSGLEKISDFCEWHVALEVLCPWWQLSSCCSSQSCTQGLPEQSHCTSDTGNTIQVTTIHLGMADAVSNHLRLYFAFPDSR